METKKILKLNDIEAYKTAFKLSNYVWELIIKWDYFAKDLWEKAVRESYRFDTS